MSQHAGPTVFQVRRYTLASSWVVRQLKGMRPGQVIALEGYLVDAAAPDGWRWNTSLTRKDTGTGACELFWVENAYVVR